MIISIKINSQSLDIEDTQVGHILQKYTLDKYTLDKYTLEKYSWFGVQLNGLGTSWLGGEGLPEAKFENKWT